MRTRRGDDTEDAAEADADERGQPSGDAGVPTAPRRTRPARRRPAAAAAGAGGAGRPTEEENGSDDPPNTVVRVREPRKRAAAEGKSGAEDDDGVLAQGSTRLEAKKQRRREGREAGRGAPVITEAEFLARRESVDRVMVVRQAGDRTQIAVLEDGVLAEHYVSTASSDRPGGQRLPGQGAERPAVDGGRLRRRRQGPQRGLYAGEVNWDAAGLEGPAARIELALKSGDSVLVQVTKDPIGHKGARLTSQVSLARALPRARPRGSMTGISRKLPGQRAAGSKSILKKVVPEGAGVIVRTAAEGASEEELHATWPGSPRSGRTSRRSRRRGRPRRRCSTASRT